MKNRDVYRLLAVFHGDARLCIRFADDGELQTRSNYRVNQWP